MKSFKSAIRSIECFAKLTFLASVLLINTSLLYSQVTPVPGQNIWKLTKQLGVMVEDIDQIVDEASDAIHYLDTFGLIELEDWVDHLESVGEEVDANLEDITETLMSIDDTLISVQDTLEEVETSFSIIDERAQEIESVLDLMEDALESIESSQEEIESVLEQIADQAENVADVAAIVSEQALEVEDVVDLINDIEDAILARASVIEDIVADIQEGVITIEQEVNQLASTTDTIADTVLAWPDQFEDIADTVADIESAVDQDLQELEAVSSSLEDIESVLENIEQDTVLLESTLDHIGELEEQIENQLPGIISTVDEIVVSASILDSLVDTLVPLVSELDSLVDVVDSKVDVLGSQVDLIENNTISIIETLITTESIVEHIESVSEIIVDTVSIIDSAVDSVGSVIEEINSQVDLLEAAGCTYTITQADVDAGGGTYTITNPGVYCVAEQLESDQTVISIEDTECVVLDLHGYCVVGSDESGQPTISASNSEDIVIKNGGIASGQNGVFVTGCSRIVLSDLRISVAQLEEVLIVDSEDFVVLSCSASGGRFSSVFSVANSIRGVFKDCIAYEAQAGYGFVAVVADVSALCAYFNCKAINCGTGGFNFSGDSYVLENCVAEGSDGAGFELLSAATVAKRCIAIQNSVGFLIGGNNSLVRDSIALKNTTAQIRINTGVNNAGVLGNYVVGTVDGISVGIENLGTNSQIYNNVSHNSEINFSNVDIALSAADLIDTQSGFWSNVS
jgi:predicted  nucleic acid-binding Zn-ribbon protein